MKANHDKTSLKYNFMDNMNTCKILFLCSSVYPLYIIVGNVYKITSDQMLNNR